MSLVHRGEHKIPTVVLMTEDVANRQKAEQDGLSSISGTFPAICLSCALTVLLVRKYVDAMKESSQLSDLLSAAGSNDLEPTKAVAGRTALYPDVRAPDFILLICAHIRTSIYLRRLSLRGSRLGRCIKDISTPISTTT